MLKSMRLPNVKYSFGSSIRITKKNTKINWIPSLPYFHQFYYIQKKRHLVKSENNNSQTFTLFGWYTYVFFLLKWQNKTSTNLWQQPSRGLIQRRTAINKISICKLSKCGANTCINTHNGDAVYSLVVFRFRLEL